MSPAYRTDPLAQAIEEAARISALRSQPRLCWPR